MEQFRNFFHANLQKERHHTFQYKPLESSRHIRLLEIYPNSFRDGASQNQPDRLKSRYLSIAAIVHTSLDEEPEFESISYTWGSGVRTGKLHIALDDRYIALTPSLVEALPYLFSRSTTGRLWIDQLCINQGDLEERAQQVSLMGDIYKSAASTMIWLGPEDQHTAKVRAVIDELENTSFANSDETRNSRIRNFITNPQLEYSSDAFCAFLGRPWFSRGWIIQEYVLSKSVSFICGSEAFTEQDLEDTRRLSGKWHNFGRLQEMRESVANQEGLLGQIEMMRLLCQSCGYFETTEPIDKLFSLLGLWIPTNFKPSYTANPVEVFTDFTRCIAHETGSLDFLSASRNSQAWCVQYKNGSIHFRSTPPSKKSGQTWCITRKRLPSWVPVWTDIAGASPYSIALAGVGMLVDEKVWNASKGRKNVPSKPRSGIGRRDEQLLVRGGIVDSVDQVFDKEFDPRTHASWRETTIPYIERFVSELSLTLPLLSNWSILDLLKELSKCEAGGLEPTLTPEEILETIEKEGDSYYLGFLDERKVVVTENGHIGLAPSWCVKGNRIAIFHGCNVPIIVSDRGDGAFVVVGDCFLDHIMHGEAVYWEESEAEEFVLI